MKFITTKIVDAVALTATNARNLGYRVSEDADPHLPGLEITYEDGYKSWVPEDVFKRDARPCSGLPFGHAIEAAKKGCAIARKGWNGKGMFVVYMPELRLPPFNTQDTNRKVNDRTAKWIGEDAPLNSVPYFAMRAANGDWVPGWLASQTDMLSDDWLIVENTVQWIADAAGCPPMHVTDPFTWMRGWIEHAVKSNVIDGSADAIMDWILSQPMSKV